jgi:hypothetical protein
MAMSSANATKLEAVIKSAGFHLAEGTDGSIAAVVDGNPKVVDTRRLTICLEDDVASKASS